MKMRMKPVYEASKRNFPSYITNNNNNQESSMKTSGNLKSQHQFGKVIIFSDNPDLLRKMNEKKKRTHTHTHTTISNRIVTEQFHEKKPIENEDNQTFLRNSTQTGEENKDFVQFPNKVVIANKDFKSRKITQYALKRNLYLPKINNLLKNTVPRYEREAYEKKKALLTNQNEHSKNSKDFVNIVLNI